MTPEIATLHHFVSAGLTHRKWHKYLIEQSISYTVASKMIQAHGFDDLFPKIDWSAIRYALLQLDKNRCIEDLKAADICLHGYTDIPTPFLQLAQPPMYLYTYGVGTMLQQQYKGIIGSRRPQRYTLSSLKLFLNHACADQEVLVSGCASGVDACVHEISLQHKIPSIMVLGSGHHAVSYSKKKYIQALYESGGCVISEYPPNFEATKYSFPQRNRLIAALSRELYVFQAQEKSGSLITARYAKQLGIPLKVLPGQIGDTTFRGSHQLIADGADIFFDMRSPTSPSGLRNTMKDFDTPFQKTLYTGLKTPMLLDQLYAQYKKSSREDIDQALFALELRGYITQEAGTYSLAIS